MKFKSNISKNIQLLLFGAFVFITDSVTADPCGNGRYWDGRVCSSCDESCNSCNDFQSCNTCAPGWGKASLATNSLCFKCPDGQFVGDNGFCADCAPHCTTCTDGVSCTACKDPVFNLDSVGNCIECGQGSFYNQLTRACQGCPEHCSTCSSDKECDQCKPGFGQKAFFNAPNVCGACENGLFLSGQQCEPCTKNCDTCSDLFTCNSCNKPFYVASEGRNKDKCVLGCGPEKWFDYPTDKCESCLANCDDCVDGTSCNKCNSGFARERETGVCFVCPAEKFLTDKESCGDCSDNCASCKSASQCDKCHAPYQVNMYGLCTICPAGEYFNKEEKMCRTCHDSCSTCSTGDSCSTCNAPNYVSTQLTISPSLCVFCVDPNYLDGNTCKKCSKDCLKCATGSQCDKCAPGTNLNADGACVVCKSDEHFDEESKTCNKCGPRCTTCSSKDDWINCDSCVKGAFVQAGSNTCEKCLNDCASCSGDGQACDECKAGLGRRFDLDKDRCYKCTAEQFLTSGQECIECSPHCLDCASTTQCTTCELPYMSNINGQCVKPEPGFYFNVQDKVIKKCHDSCATCSTGEGCDSCAENFKAQAQTIDHPNFCVHCTGSNYLQGNVCRACSKDCMSCDTFEQCDVCAAGTTLNADGQCVVCSSDEYFDQGSKRCTECLPNDTRCQSLRKATECKVGAYLAGGVCKECQNDCASCSNGNSCDTCLSGLGRRFGVDSSRCYRCTAEQFLVKENEQCVTCSEQCTSCADADTCGVCKAPYQVNASGKCLKCEPGSFFHKTMKMCMPCHESCETCSNGESCDKCSSGYLSSTSLTISNSLCIQCNGPFYLEANACKACIGNCASCNNGEVCNKCTEGFELDINGQCITCEKGRYFNTKSRACETCGPLCTECNKGDTCTACKPGAHLNPTNMQCEHCPYDCATCSDSNTCTSCKAGFGRRPDSNPKRCYKCSAGQFLHKQQCKACSANCVECKDANTCTFCKKPFSIGAKGDCLNCLGATFFDKPSKSCQNCAWNCEKCSDRTSCNRCSNGYAKAFFSIGAPVTDVCKKCPKGKYATTHAEGQDCKECSSNCADCDNGKQCKDCAPGHELSFNGGCIACSKGTYYDGETKTCKACDSSCGSCTGPETCDSCNSGLGKFEGSALCQKCHKGTHLEDEVCKGCAHNCLECLSGAQCTKCKSPHKLDYTGLCVSGQCGRGKFFDDRLSRKCEPCRSNCASCNHENDCLDCNANFGKHSKGRHPNFCYQCAIDEFLDGQTCTQCPNNCARCTNSKTCTDCIAPNVLDQNRQCVACPVGAFYDKDTGTCKACDGSCASCDSAKTCSKCKTGFGKMTAEQNLCMRATPGTFLDVVTIKPCNDRCTECSQGDSCLSCKEPFLLSGTGQCVTCEEGTFFDKDGTRQCQSCSNNCGSCERGDSCKSCEVGFGKFSKGRSDDLCWQCSADQYLVGQTCRDCGSNCERCINSDRCVACTKPYRLDASGACLFCQKGSGTFFNEQTKTCQKCHDSCSSCSNQYTCDACSKDFEKTVTTHHALCFDCPAHQKLTAGGCKSCGSGCRECQQATLGQAAYCQDCVDNSDLIGNQEKTQMQCKCQERFGLRKGENNVVDACAPCALNCLKCNFPEGQEFSTCGQCDSGYILNEGNTQCVVDPSIAEQRLNLHEQRVFDYTLWPALVVGLLILLAILVCLICLCYKLCCEEKESTSRNAQSEANLDRSPQVHESNMNRSNQMSNSRQGLIVSPSRAGNSSRAFNDPNEAMSPMNSPQKNAIRTVSLSASPTRMQAQSPKLRSSSPKRVSVFENPNGLIMDRSAPSHVIESEQSQGNYNLNKIALPDHDQRVSFPGERRSHARRGDSPHFSYRNRRDALNQSPSPVRQEGNFRLNPVAANRGEELSVGQIEVNFDDKN